MGKTEEGKRKKGGRKMGREGVVDAMEEEGEARR